VLPQVNYPLCQGYYDTEVGRGMCFYIDLLIVDPVSVGPDIGEELSQVYFQRKSENCLCRYNMVYDRS